MLRVLSLAPICTSELGKKDVIKLHLLLFSLNHVSISALRFMTYTRILCVGVCLLACSLHVYRGLCVYVYAMHMYACVYVYVFRGELCVYAPVYLDRRIFRTITRYRRSSNRRDGLQSGRMQEI